MSNNHYIFITGGVVSSLGKGIATAALGTVLEARGLSLRFLKLDPYLNVDPGTLSPYQHGEVFVTEDGTETDLDLGHYERFTQVKTTRHDNYTAGKIYADVLNRERQGDYLGGTVQVIPHVTDAIKQAIQSANDDTEVTLVEIGGTVGDIESLPFLEAIRQMRIELGIHKTYFIHLTLVPYLSTAGELKTKPTQHSTKELRSIGIQPDMLICRSSDVVPENERKKIALFTNLNFDSVITLPDINSIYKIPLLLFEQKVDTRIVDALHLKTKEPNLDEWRYILTKQNNYQSSVTVGIIGKYTELTDSYKSIAEALTHAGIHSSNKVKIRYIEADTVPNDPLKLDDCFNEIDAILIPGGFGTRGIEGKIIAARYAREQKIPYLGICLGMQIAVIELARHKALLKDAHSSECDPHTPYPVIALVTEWQTEAGHTETRTHTSPIGGTMRLGSQLCELADGSRIATIYKRKMIKERHRHRYEVNPQWVPQLQKAGLIVAGKSIDGLVEVIELEDHPWFVGCQFHPEFTSTPRQGHPLFISFVQAAVQYKKSVT